MNLVNSLYFFMGYMASYILLIKYIPGNYMSLIQNLYSIGGIIFAITVMIFALIKNRDNMGYRVMLILGSTWWLLGDITWSYTTIVMESEVSFFHMSTFFYALSNFSLAASIYMLIKKFTRKWDGIKITMEVSILGGIWGYLAWGLFFDSYISEVISSKFDSQYLLQFFYVFSDFLIIFGLLIFYLFNKNYLKFSINRIEALGFAMWFCTDLTYSYMEIHNLSLENSSFDLLWPISLMIIGISTLESKRGVREREEENNLNVMNHAYLIVFVIVVALYMVDKKVPILAIIPIFLFRFVLSKYMKVFEENEKLNIRYRESNEVLFRIANIDPLTNLFNRRKLIEELEGLAERNGDQIKSALLFVDLDRFKNINDWHGHEVGDKVLIEAAQRLRSNTGEKDLVARQGGDEFVVILNDVRDEKDVQEKAARIVKSFREPFVISEDKVIQSSVSLGSAIFPTDAADHYALMRFADISLYKAKSEGKNRLVMYNDKMEVEQNRKFEIESRLYEALNKNEMMVYYQPQIETATQKIIGMEALLRWKNPELGGFVSPGEFIGIAEENGFILNIGDFVIQQASKAIKYINETYGRDIKVAINVSPKQFHTSEMTYDIERAIEEYGLKPSWIDIEITESLAMNNEEKVMIKLQKLKKVGINLSIDDFGTGYSSLSYLKRFPVDTLKIDIEFVRGITKNNQDFKIVKAIIAMCNELDIKTIAEGVEEVEQYEILKSLNCDQIQGYYFSKPLPLEEIEERFFKEQR